MSLPKNFRVIKKIEEGTFGTVYHALNTLTNQEVAVKIEKVSNSKKHLINESKVYHYLHNATTTANKGIPSYNFLKAQGDFKFTLGKNTSNVLVLDLLGPSLQELM